MLGALVPRSVPGGTRVPHALGAFHARPSHLCDAGLGRRQLAPLRPDLHCLALERRDNGREAAGVVLQLDVDHADDWNKADCSECKNGQGHASLCTYPCPCQASAFLCPLTFPDVRDHVTPSTSSHGFPLTVGVQKNGQRRNLADKSRIPASGWYAADQESVLVVVLLWRRREGRHRCGLSKGI